VEPLGETLNIYPARPPSRPTPTRPEWEQARKTAHAAVEKNYREMRDAPRLDCVRAPADGRMYLISNLMPERLAGRYRIWVVLHLAIFIAAVGGLARALA